MSWVIRAADETVIAQEDTYVWPVAIKVPAGTKARIIRAEEQGAYIVEIDGKEYSLGRGNREGNLGQSGSWKRSSDAL